MHLTRFREFFENYISEASELFAKEATAAAAYLVFSKQSAFQFLLQVSIPVLLFSTQLLQKTFLLQVFKHFFLHEKAFKSKKFRTHKAFKAILIK